LEPGANPYGSFFAGLFYLVTLLRGVSEAVTLCVPLGKVLVLQNGT